MKIKGNKIEIHGKEFDYSITFDEAKELFLNEIVEINKKYSIITIKEDLLLNVKVVPVLYFDDHLDLINLHPFKADEGLKLDIKDIEKHSLELLSQCDNALEKEFGVTKLKKQYNSNKCNTYISDSFIIELNYVDREYMINISIFDNKMQNVVNTILQHANYFVEKISKETKNNLDISKKIMLNMRNINNKLNNQLFKWMIGEEIDFEYKGITIRDIQTKYNQSYIQSIFDMSAIMNNDAFVGAFKNNFTKK